MNKKQEEEIVLLLNIYSKALTLLEQYDKNNLKIFKGKKSKFVLKYEDCLEVISELKKQSSGKKEYGSLFGNEVGHKFESAVKNIYQTFNKKQLYSSIGEKTANFLYLAIKDHPFSDGNKRIAAFLFVHFLNKSNYLYNIKKEKKISNNTLAALTLLIAESRPKEKDQMIAFITQLLKEN